MKLDKETLEREARQHYGKAMKFGENQGGERSAHLAASHVLSALAAAIKD